MYEFYFQTILCIAVLVYFLTKQNDVFNIPGLSFNQHNKQLIVTNIRTGETVLNGTTGIDFNIESLKSVSCKTEDEQICLVWDGIAKLNITKNYDRNNVDKNKLIEHQCYTIEWTSLDKESNPQDCFEFNAPWYGGGELYTDRWPLNKITMNIVPFLSYDVGLKKNHFGSVLERLWFTSEGAGIYVNDNVPLHVGYGKNACFKSAYTSPYENLHSLNTSLSYVICVADGPKTIRNLMHTMYIPKPKAIPDIAMFTTPIWSTWVRYKTTVSQDKIIQFAEEIKHHNISDLQRMEIDDMYTAHYGDYSFDVKKFPNPRSMINKLHELGFNVTSWVMPFCDVDADSFNEGAKKGFFVRTKNSTQPGMVQWWNGISAVVDYTNPEASKWYFKRLSQLSELGIDSFKFDAGEIQYLPDDFKLFNRTFNPGQYSTQYVSLAFKNVNNKLEVRAGYKTQHLPIFVRMMDKDSIWTGHRGLDTVIPTALLFGILGYPFILPDMIGGNAYDETGIGIGERPQKELYIRWLQLNTFLPAMQFSIPPWDYDNEVMEVFHDMSNIRNRYVVPSLLSAAAEAVRTGAPIIRPIWWIDEKDNSAYNIDDQFTIGDTILVAPILKQGTTTTDVYLPKGTWYDPNLKKTFLSKEGMILNNYSATLLTIPYFVHQ